MDKNNIGPNVDPKEINELRIKKLIAFRNQCNLNQKEFATKIGMNISYYCRLENGGTFISDKTLKKIAMVFDIPYDIILNDESPSFSEGLAPSVEETPATLKTSFENSAHKILDEIIAYGGKNNLTYMKDLNRFLVEVQYFLEYKEQFHDLCENEDKLLDEGQALIDILIGMS